MQERKEREKRDKRMRELEARDEENKEIHAAREARRNGARPTPAMEKVVEKHKGGFRESEREVEGRPSRAATGRFKFSA